MVPAGEVAELVGLVSYPFISHSSFNTHLSEHGLMEGTPEYYFLRLGEGTNSVLEGDLCSGMENVSEAGLGQGEEVG